MRMKDLSRTTLARLVYKRFAHEDGFDYGDTFATVATCEGVIMLLEYMTYKKFKYFQMGVKYVVLNGVLEEEVYIEQPHGFALSKDEDMLCKL